MLAATHLQRFRFKCVALVQQEYHNIVSSSRGFCRFFREKIQKSQDLPSRKRFTSATNTSNIPCFCCVRVAPLHFYGHSVTLYVLHFILQHIFCNGFHAFLCIFICLHAYFKVQQTFVCAFCRSTPLPQPFSELQPAFGCTFCNKKTAQAAFSGPSVLCRIPYIKRRAAPKSRPSTIQAML